MDLATRISLVLCISLLGFSANAFAMKATCGSFMMFQCHNGDCISQSFRCDRHPDCADESDEENCYQTTEGEEVLGCSEEQYQCQEGDQCIDKTALCNGTPDCPSGDDEQHCTTDAPAHHEHVSGQHEHSSAHHEQVSGNLEHSSGNLEQVSGNLKHSSHSSGNLEQVSSNLEHSSGHHEQVSANLEQVSVHQEAVSTGVRTCPVTLSVCVVCWMLSLCLL